MNKDYMEFVKHMGSFETNLNIKQDKSKNGNNKAKKTASIIPIKQKHRSDRRGQG